MTTTRAKLTTVVGIGVLACAATAATAGPYDPPAPPPPPPNNAPIAKAKWVPATGTVPSFVRFDAGESSDPDAGDQLSYFWDLDGDGQFDDATGVTANSTYRAVGRYAPALRVTDRAGAESIARLDVVVVPKGTARGSVSPRCRWRAQYFRGKGLLGKPVVARCEPALRHDWDFGRPLKRVRPDRFSVRWRGPYRFPGGPIRFEVSADDGLRVWIDGRKVFDRWREGAYGRWEWVQVVRAGVHDIRVDYAENEGTASVAVGWEPTRKAPFAARKVS